MEDKRLPGNISEAEEQKEFEQLIHTIVSNQELWYLSRGEEFLLTEDEWGDKLPLWPTAAEAAVNGTQEWEGCVAESVSLAEFLYQWIPFLKEENLGVSLGWKDGAGFVMELAELAETLRHEAAEQGILLEAPAEDTELEEKYTQFIEEVVVGNSVWILHKGDAILMVGSEDGGRMPVWSSREAAAADCGDEWEACEPTGITPQEFAEEWIPELVDEDSNLLLALGDGLGIHADAAQFGQDLTRELKKQAPGKVVAFRRGRRNGAKPLS